MKVLFVNYHHLDSNSGIHIFNLANHLTRLGVECMVCVPNQKEAVAVLGEPLFEVINFEDLCRDRSKRTFDLLHVWTPREVVRKMTRDLLEIYSCPYIVHLEDNEEYLVGINSGIPFHILQRLPVYLLDLLIRPYMSHPRRYKEFLAGAAGITIIMEPLRLFCPEKIPKVTIWAGYQEDMQWDRTANLEFRRKLGIADAEFVVAYTGNAHKANRREVSSLYQAIGILQYRGIRVKLVRTGTDIVPLLSWNLMAFRKNYYIDLGYIPRSDLPSVLSIADVLIQPGKPDQFNAYRFPSKLPEYLASGKPVILPKTNIGNYLKEKDECLWLEKGDPLDIAQKLEILLSNDQLRRRIGRGGYKFAEENLKWGHIASKLHSFYLSLLNKAHL